MRRTLPVVVLAAIGCSCDAYAIDAGAAPQQLGVVEVLVWQTTTGGFLPGATVDFSPLTGDQQTCRQSPGAPTRRAGSGAI